MTLNLTEHKVSFAEGDIRTLDIFELGSNYRVKRLTIHEGGKLKWKSISVFSDKEYMPEIQYDDGFWNEGKPTFMIQTCAYGSKNVAEIEKIIAGYQEAVEAVRILTMNFC